MITDAEKLQHLRELEVYLDEEKQWDEKHAVCWARETIEHNAEAVAAETERCVEVIRGLRMHHADLCHDDEVAVLTKAAAEISRTAPKRE